MRDANVPIPAEGGGHHEPASSPHASSSVLLYYRLKPMIPRALRMALRRAWTRRLLRRCSAAWPIDEAAGRTPADWAGWPHGKEFALVLTHDVESRRGLGHCHQLVELEMRLGVRSSFNFVPEGPYATPDVLRAFLGDHGFEVGVHDLHHDGRLYRSRAIFENHAKRINQYLVAWRAVGFRSGFMFHDLRWLADLDILYDASTFDTDPFEPQPDGVKTIFPFQVVRSEGKPYVELPYTLPQDSTLFLLLKERGIDVWKRKLDWVAAHGGLALINVHPDYMDFDGGGRASTYPATLYERFLEHVSRRYSDRYWQALPRDVATHVMTVSPELTASAT